MPPDDDKDMSVRERMAVIEALFRHHEAQAIERRAELTKSLEGINKKLDSKECTLHASRMLQLDQDLKDYKRQAKECEERLEGKIKTNRDKLSEVERAVLVATGGLAVIVFFLNFFK